MKKIPLGFFFQNVQKVQKKNWNHEKDDCNFVPHTPHRGPQVLGKRQSIETAVLVLVYY